MGLSWTLPLYVLFIAYTASAILSVYSGSSNLFYYVASIFGLAFTLSFLFLIKYRKSFRVKETDAILISIVFIFSLFSSIYAKDILGVVLCLMFLSQITFFKIQEISLQELIKFCNYTFLIYFFLSLISYFGIAFHHPIDMINSFDINYGFISFETLYGLEGSTADIDSYSSVIVLLNLFLNRSKSKYLFMGVALLALIWTARFTPLVSFVFSVFIFLVVRNKWMALLSIFFIFIGFAAFTYIEMYQPYGHLFSSVASNKLVLQLATHGRTFIWSEQLKCIHDNFHLLDYVFGNFKYAEISIPWSDGTTSNSHNSFLALYFRMGILALFLLVLFVVKVFKSFNRYTFPLLFSIFLSATTNGTIFYVGNPIFIILTIYLIYFYKSEKSF